MTEYSCQLFRDAGFSLVRRRAIADNGLTTFCTQILAQLYYCSQGPSRPIVTKSCIRAHMIAANSVALQSSEASNKYLAIPYLMNSTSIALYTLFLLSFRLRCLEILFCGFGHVTQLQQQTERLLQKPVETCRNSEEKATCLSQQQARRHCGNDFALCRLGRYAIMENIDFDQLDGDYALNYEFSTSSSPRASLAAERVDQPSGEHALPLL